MTAASGNSSRAWMAVALLWFVACFNYVARIMLTTMHGSVVAAIPMTETQFGLLTSVFLWSYGALSPVAGFIADRHSRKRVIVISMLAWSVVTWLTGYARTFPELLAMRALMGVSEACYLPAALALITDYHRGHTRSLANGIHLTGCLFGGALGGLGGWLAASHNWSYPFTIVGLLGIGYGVMLIFALHDAPRESEDETQLITNPPKIGFGQALSSISRCGSLYLVLAAWVLSSAVSWAVVGWMPTYVQEHFHLGQGQAGFSATGCVNIGGLLGLIVGGYWGDRWARTNRRGRIFVPAVGLCLAAPTIFLAAKASFLFMAVTGLFLYGAVTVFFDANLMPMLCLIVDPRYRATCYGMFNALATVFGGLSIYAGGSYRDSHGDLGTAFAFCAIGMVICSACIILVRPRKSLKQDPDLEAVAAYQPE